MDENGITKNGGATMGFDAEKVLEHGFCVVQDIVSEQDITNLLARAETITAEADLTKAGVFTTDDQKRHSDEYFIRSAHNISCFWEEGADRSKTQNAEINKIGHALHYQDSVFTEFSRNSQFGDYGEALGLAEPVIAQSMFIFKRPFIGGAVDSHCDSTFLYTEPNSCFAFWFALEDCTEENGCLWVAPGSHKNPITKRFTYDENSGAVNFTGEDPKLTSDQFQPVCCAKGSLVVMHGGLYHYSKQNTSNNPRPAFVIHVVDNNAHWDKENWSQPTATDPFIRFKNH